jgi:serine protease Do
MNDFSPMTLSKHSAKLFAISRKVMSRNTLLITLSIFATSAMSAQWPGLIPFQIRNSGSYLGLRLADLKADRVKMLKLGEISGVEIVGVLDGAAADLAGLRPGDVISSYNGEKVLGAQQFSRLVAETPVGRQVQVVCWRAGETKKLTVTTGSRDEDQVTESIATIRVMDIPSTMMVWRNSILGFESELLSEQLAQAFGVKQGILIWTVTGGSPAQQAGLRAGDVVTGICGRIIHSPREVGLVLQQAQNSQKPISINVVRDHKPISVTIALDNAAVH